MKHTFWEVAQVIKGFSAPENEPFVDAFLEKRIISAMEFKKSKEESERRFLTRDQALDYIVNNDINLRNRLPLRLVHPL